MSVTASIADPAVPVARVALRPSGRITLLLAVIVATSVSAFGLAVASYVRPTGADGDLPTYAAIEPIRDYLWAFFLIAGVQLVIGVAAAAVAGLMLAPARGSRWAFAGACLLWLGAACYGVGIGGWATVYYFATDRAVLGAGRASALVGRVNDDAVHTLAVPIAGAGIVVIGSLLLTIGVWRAGTVPKWFLVLSAATSIAAFVVPPSSAAGLVVEGVSSLTTIAIGWYAWRLYAVRGASAATRR